MADKYIKGGVKGLEKGYYNLAEGKAPSQPAPAKQGLNSGFESPEEQAMYGQKYAETMKRLMGSAPAPQEPNQMSPQPGDDEAVNELLGMQDQQDGQMMKRQALQGMIQGQGAAPQRQPMPSVDPRTAQPQLTQQQMQQPQGSLRNQLGAQISDDEVSKMQGQMPSPDDQRYQMLKKLMQNR